MESFAKKTSTTHRRRYDLFWGFLFCGFCGAALIAQLLRYSHLKPLWLDEMYTFYQVDGKSLPEMMASLRTGINLLPPLYFICLTSALRFFKFSPLVGRGLSCGFIVASVPVLWSVLRRNVGPAIASIAIAGVLFGSRQIFFHNSEARPYGLYFFCASLVLWGFTRAAETEKYSWWLLALIAFANAVLPSANYFGGLYSAVALAVIIYFDWRSGRPRIQVYIAYLIGWGLFAISVLPLCVAQYKARGSAGTAWLPIPSEAFRYLLLEWFSSFRIGAAFCLVVLPLVYFVAKKKSPKPLSTQNPATSFATVAQLGALGLAWLAVPLFFVLQAFVTGKNLYSDRYFIASDLGAIIVIAAALSYGCDRLSNVSTLEDVKMSKAIRSAYLLFMVGGIVFVAQRFCRNYSVPVYEGAIAVAKARAWPTTPQATFSIEFYTESLFHATPDTRLILLTPTARERENINRFHRDFRAIDLQTLSSQHEFLFVDSYLTPKSFQLPAWAAAHGFSTQKVGEYSQFYLPWDFTLVRSQAVAEPPSP